MRYRTLRSRTLLAAFAAVVSAMVCPAPSSAGDTAIRMPASGELVSSRAVARATPDARGRIVRVLHRLRPNHQFAVVLAVAARRGADGRWWYRLSLPGRPNGQRGWVRGELLDLRPAVNRIVVHVADRRIEVRRIADHRLLVSGIVAVGKPGAETPLGRDFYVQGRFFPRDPFFGRFVLETSAYSKLSDWPGGGLAGIHGTSQPQLLGQAVSHGCVRVSDRVAGALQRLAALGTPIDLLP